MVAQSVLMTPDEGWLDVVGDGSIYTGDYRGYRLRVSHVMPLDDPDGLMEKSLPEKPWHWQVAEGEVQVDSGWEESAAFARVESLVKAHRKSVGKDYLPSGQLR